MRGSGERGPSDYVNGRWVAIDGEDVVSVNPARPSEVVWAGSPSVEHVGQAVEAVRAAAGPWGAMEPAKRFAVLERYAAITKERSEQVAALICDETGKAMWECRGEAAALGAKVGITLEQGANSGMSRVSGYEVGINESRVGRCLFRPHGVMAVVGPFNFPAHLPNGHIVPALAMGNTVVFKPSDKTPAVGQLLVEMFVQALEDKEIDIPCVINLVHGRADVASALTTHADIDGILFTGSWGVGRKILEANLDHPGRIIALEMGGNNPAIVMDDADLEQAAIEVTRCAFNTTGQRCTSTRRLIVHEKVADRLVPAICKAASNLLIGDPREGLAGEPVFMGPIISEQARQAVLDAQARFAKQGGEVLVESTAMDSPAGGYYITPSVIRVDRFELGCDDAGCDEEVFGPMLRVSVVSSFDEAIRQANATRYGLAASVFTQRRGDIERFVRESRAGCVNVNTGTAGASSKLPFGGLGLSGNHRPAGSFSLDYCAYPVASMVEAGDAATKVDGMRFEREWLG